MVILDTCSYCSRKKKTQERLGGKACVKCQNFISLVQQQNKFTSLTCINNKGELTSPKKICACDGQTV